MLWHYLKKTCCSYKFPTKIHSNIQVKSRSYRAFFAAIRSHGKWNNNPTTGQFTAAYKRLLVRHHVEATGNCIQQDNTQCLPVDVNNVRFSSTTLSTLDIIRDGVKINDKFMTVFDVYVARQYDLLPKLFEVDLTENINIPSDDNFNFYREASVAYIAGYVSKMATKMLSCDTCIKALCSKDLPPHPFIALKDRGGLFKPSTSVMKICMCTENYFQRLLKSTGGNLPQQGGLCDIISTSVMVDTHNIVFSELEEHMLDSSVEDNHIQTLVKLVSKCYSKIRFHHLAKEFTEKLTGTKIRKDLSKLILFKHQ